MNVDLSEARRLLGAGMKIVELHAYTKRPIGDDWNKHPATSINPDATGYGLMLEQNKLCSLDPDNYLQAKVGMRALEFDLDALMEAGVRTVSTRQGSGGRSTFAAEGDLAWLSFRGPGGVAIEFRANSPNLQDCIPGVVYDDKQGRRCHQAYANGRQLDDAPPLPDDLLLWWQLCSNDVEYLRAQQRQFFKAIGVEPYQSISTGKGGSLAFAAPGYRTAFNARVQVETLLDKHGYAYDGRTRRWAPPNASGAPGIRAIPGRDDLWRSDHASDPLMGTFDAWTANVVLNFAGDVEAAKRDCEATGIYVPPPTPPEQELPPLELYANEATLASTKGPPPAPMPTPSRRMQWAELEGKEPPGRTWLISHWLTYGITLLAGRGGIGKSLLGQTVATALALGRTFIDEITAPQTVLMWSCEDDHDELWRRQVAINRFLGCTMGDIEGRLILESRVGSANSMWSLAYGALNPGPALKDWHEQANDLKAGVCLLDNIAHVFGGNENDRHHVTSFINGLAPTHEQHRATILLGHTARSQGSEFAGSAAWENAARMRWLFDSKLPDAKPGEEVEPVDGVRYLAKRKTNYSVNDWRRFAYQDGVFRPESVRSGFAAQSRKDDARRCVLSGFRKVAETGLTSTSSTASPEYLPKQMMAMKLAEDFTVRELADALAALLISGRFKIAVVGKYSNRSPKKGLVEVTL